MEHGRYTPVRLLTSGPMRMPRRLVAVTAALAVAWTALWPLVSSAKLLASGEAMPLCHQAGMQVDPSVSPEQPGAPGKNAKQHCPLCIMAFYTGTSAPLLAPPASQVATLVVRESYCAPVPADVDTPFPQSRAPPAVC